MEDLGLVSLRSIVRGAVRIEKNPQLCYVDTIDWTALTSVDHEDDFVLQNKVINQIANRSHNHIASHVVLLLLIVILVLASKQTDMK